VKKLNSLQAFKSFMQMLLQGHQVIAGSFQLSSFFSAVFYAFIDMHLCVCQ